MTQADPSRHLVSIGAVVISLSFLIEPFFQALISDYGRLVPVGTDNTATIGKSVRFHGGTECITPIHGNPPTVSTTPDFGVSAALFDGLNTTQDDVLLNVPSHCASGNCTWDEFASLAICSSCFDITEHLDLSSQTETATLELYGTAQATGFASTSKSVAEKDSQYSHN